MMNIIRLIVARHGNTFQKNESPRRIGRRTDIPLVESGREQATKLGQHLKTEKLVPTRIFSGRLKRSVETAEILCENIGLSANLIELSDSFSELDFGDDENKLEEDVILRVGFEKMAEWESKGIIPEGWRPYRDEIIHEWVSFANNLVSNSSGETILVVTSSGTARFALSLIGTTSLKEALTVDLSAIELNSTDKEASVKNKSLKLRTGAYGILSYADNNNLKISGWSLDKWNVRP
jgi:probable phosphoglycerate mutase